MSGGELAALREQNEERCEATFLTPSFTILTLHTLNLTPIMTANPFGLESLRVGNVGLPPHFVGDLVLNSLWILCVLCASVVVIAE